MILLTTQHTHCAWPRCAIAVSAQTNRYLVFQVLPHTLGLGPEAWRVMAKCHEIRNRGEYEGDLDVDERIVADLIAACEAVVAKLDALSALPSEGDRDT